MNGCLRSSLRILVRMSLCWFSNKDNGRDIFNVSLNESGRSIKKPEKQRKQRIPPLRKLNAFTRVRPDEVGRHPVPLEETQMAVR